MDRQEYKRAEGTIRSHPDWSDELIASSANVSEEDVAAGRLAVETGPREQELA